MSNYSPALPIRKDPVNGFANTQTIKEVSTQNLKMVILTAPGERIMDPGFGVGLRNFLFEQNNESTYSMIRAKINSQVKEYLPFLEILNIDFDSDINEPNFKANTVLVTIRFFITPTATESVLSLTV